jgi:hypothetical protein
MDRYGRNGGGGGGTPYIMPMFEDGSAYGPGDPVYNRVTSLMPPQQWNGLSDGQKWTMLVNAQGDVDNAMNFQSRAAKGSPHPASPEIDEMFRLMQGSSNLSHLDALRGIFGSAPSPPPDPNEYQGPFMPIQGTPTPSPTPVPNPTPPLPQGTPTSGASSFAQALARLMRG